MHWFIPSGRLESVLRGERSEEHTSELQSLRHLVCRLLLEKKNTALLEAHQHRPAHEVAAVRALPVAERREAGEVLRCDPRGLCQSCQAVVPAFFFNETAPPQFPPFPSPAPFRY